MFGNLDLDSAGVFEYLDGCDGCMGIIGIVIPMCMSWQTN